MGRGVGNRIEMWRGWQWTVHFAMATTSSRLSDRDHCDSLVLVRFPARLAVVGFSCSHTSPGWCSDRTSTAPCAAIRVDGCSLCMDCGDDVCALCVRSHRTAVTTPPTLPPRSDSDTRTQQHSTAYQCRAHTSHDTAHRHTSPHRRCCHRHHCLRRHVPVRPHRHAGHEVQF